MALVSRIALLGQTPVVRTIEQTVENVVTGAAKKAFDTQTNGAIPHQRPDGSVEGLPDQAAAVPTMPAGHIAITISFLLVVLGGVIAYVMPKAEPFQIGSAAAAYGGLLVFAGAVERVLEPFSHWLPGRHAQNVYEISVANMMNGSAGVTLTSVAHAKSKADRAVANRAILVWGMATGFATVVAASSGFYLLRMIASPDWVPTVPRWVDAIITGLVVGSGTKPLHDLITRAQTPKDSAPTS
jgi:hypothetical protein